MLANALNEFRFDYVYPGGTRHDDALKPFRKRLAEAQKFVLDRDAVAMSANVSLSKPTSILSALPWVRLPFEKTWIEFTNVDLRDAMQELGSPNLTAPGTVSRIIRSGFLMWQEGEELVVDYVHEDEAHGRKLIDLAPIRLSFRLGEGAPGVSPDMPSGSGGIELTRGRVRDNLRLITTDPEERRANDDLGRRASWTMHPDMTDIAAEMVGMVGPDKVDQIQLNQANEAKRLFQLLALPALILLNCRNAVEREHVSAPEKLNKKRVARGKPPLVEHIVVKVSLNAKVRRRAEAAGTGTGRWIRGSLVRGHFKVRKTGIFWWSPHARSGYGAVTRTTILTS